MTSSSGLHAAAPAQERQSTPVPELQREDQKRTSSDEDGRRRTRTNSGNAPRFLIRSMQTFNEKAEDMVDKLLEMADWKQEIKMHDMFGRVTLDVIAKIAFAMDVDSILDEKIQLPQNITKVMQGMLLSRDFLARFNPSKQKLIKEVRKSLDILRKEGKERILQRIKAIEDGEETPKDILTQILKSV
ncbi:unnamed protein product, partial [Ranitomeya imitator]